MKTRLGAELGYELASDLYREFLTTLVSRLSHAADERTVVYAPRSAGTSFEALVAGRPWNVAPQSDGDLGERLNDWCSAALKSATTDAVVVIGSDSPMLPVETIHDAFRCLQQHDVVLGPTDDGGYYLVGLRRPFPRLFEGIDWSSELVWAQTMERVRTEGWETRCAVLPTWYDVDHRDDLMRMQHDLATRGDVDESLNALHAFIERRLSK